MRIQLSIPNPCSENWNQMTPTQQGAFCQSCAKEVIDFTKTSTQELARKVNKGERICGRFKAAQLNVPLKETSSSNFRKNTLLLGFTSILATTAPALAQEQPKTCPTQKVEHVLGRVAVQPTAKLNNLTLTGTVKDYSGPLPGATVSIKGTELKTETDFDGNFCLQLDGSYFNSEVTLIIRYIGFETQEQKVILNSSHLEIQLTEMEEELLGEIVIDEKPNFLHRVGNLFRKKH
ncbi:carboxypeptidase-like regulatory domain-containing protein [Croceivirga sp. JEA036]|uniref:carboxypeptidase-like regulatory domain-containing protein n=1 Tax=Croceivirga sp. JEA036 TaxID=2721162 RepID=UPI00143A3BDA|nr:carboxypeptidase-like regulatory domain-containing protein [Croceivirga sp. JEA036]NJB36614.1 hypothetical protein [Croceivirga sp. JEA036]